MMRILYVEDNTLVREVTAELLAQDDREIIPVSSAEEALALFNRQPFDVVITDVSLPSMSGLELAKQILADRPQTPIVVASGYFLDLSLQNWGDGVRSIIKPFECSQIDALIDEVCAASKRGNRSHSPARS